ncbi:MAG: HNH endonuclease signature motif containing protein [Hyphomonas sp.]|uniref:HNH endonuclease signature motif containing protein n=1 Tax=Hyphomonas sp. TaxID=87 RepID=UPI0035295071
MEKKSRTPIPDNVSAQILVEADRTCCVCRDPSKAIQIHHIDENPSNNAPENLVVLCLEHHNDTQLRGGFGRKLKAAEILIYKKNWIETVVTRHAKAEEIMVRVMTNTFASTAIGSEVKSDESFKSYGAKDSRDFARKIPEIIRAAFKLIDLEYDFTTFGMVSESEAKCSVLCEIWLHLMKLRQRPHSHIVEPSFDEILSRYRQVTTEVDYALEFPEGFENASGTIKHLEAAGHRYRRMLHLVQISVEHEFRDEFGGTEETFANWLQDFQKSC